MECVVYSKTSYGGYWRRTFANAVDLILLGIAFGVLSNAPMDSRVLALLEIVIFLVYMAGFKSSKGATPGYSLLGIKIVAIDGAKATVKQIVIRLISSLFSSLVFGLGFICIAFDINKQSWHDKIAGTYVIRSGAEHVRTMEIPQTSLIRTKVFAFVAFATCLILIGYFGGIMYLLKSSDAYKLSEKYIKESPLIQEMVGSPIRFGRYPSGNVSTSAESGEAIFQIHVSGDKDKITVVTMLEKKGGQWSITKFGRIDEDRNYYDLNLKDDNVKMHSLDPNSAEAYYNRGNTYFNLGKHKRAIGDYDKAVSLNPQYAKAYNNRGAAYRQLGKFQEAIKDFNKAVNLAPNDADAYCNRGAAYINLGKYEQSIKNCNQAIHFDPNFAKAYLNRGTAYNGLGRKDLACDDWHKACELGECMGLNWAKKEGVCQ